MEEDAHNDHDAVIEFATYEDFLDSQISTLDLYYLEVIYGPIIWFVKIGVWNC